MAVAARERLGVMRRTEDGFLLAEEALKLRGGDELLVYTFWGENVTQDLRHELTHALLHSVLKDVPLWLDEGLAEFFELPPANGGVNFKHLEHLRREGFRPDLARLEQLTEVQQMNPGEYREAWAWVHLMLRTSPGARRVLLAYLAELRTTSRPGLLRPRRLPPWPYPAEAAQPPPRPCTTPPSRIQPHVPRCRAPSP